MSWNDFRARRAVLEEILARAHADPAVALRFDEVPGAIELFGSADNILLSLQHRWSNHLAARLDQAVEDGTPVNSTWKARWPPSNRRCARSSTPRPRPPCRRASLRARSSG